MRNKRKPNEHMNSHTGKLPGCKTEEMKKKKDKENKEGFKLEINLKPDRISMNSNDKNLIKTRTQEGSVSTIYTSTK